MSVSNPTGTRSKLHALLSYLESDPNNRSLIADAASAAFEEGQLEQVKQLIGRYESLSEPPAALLNLKGLAALSAGDFETAAATFQDLLAGAPGDPALRFNLAWCRAMKGEFEAAEHLLDDDVSKEVPRAAALKVQMLHHLGRLEDALEFGGTWASQRPDDSALMGALAAVAIDAERIDLAKAYASSGGANHDALAALGMLELNEDRIDESLALFERSLDSYANDARALLGKGLVLLMKGAPTDAAACIDKSAALFGRHLGSWVASGWAHLLAGDRKTARAGFERAAALDDTFAEAHGGLAVLDVLEGDLESANRRIEIAVRLDRQCLSAALARSLALSVRGDTAAADRIIRAAMIVPVGTGDRTIAQAMAAMGLAAPKGPK